MTKIKNPFRGFTIFDWCLWLGSVAAVLLSFFLCGNTAYLNLIASLVGVSGLIFLAKGHVVGQFICLAFCALYGYISFTYSYYGEMITYLGLTAPIALYGVFAWLKNPNEARADVTEVKVNRISWKEHLLALVAGAGVTTAFYFILGALNTPNLEMSTLSVLTSFLAVYYTARRSPLYAVWYALNDIVLIVLWILATLQSFEYLSMVVCFAAFLANDIYGFIMWAKMKKRQSTEE